MEPDFDRVGLPFNFDTLPLWLKPDLWDKGKNVPFRGMFFVLLYTLSFAVFAALLFVPAGIYMGADMAITTAVVWISLSVFSGSIIGLACWWDFARGRGNTPTNTNAGSVTTSSEGDSGASD